MCNIQFEIYNFDYLKIILFNFDTHLNLFNTYDNCNVDYTLFFFEVLQISETQNQWDF